VAVQLRIDFNRGFQLTKYSCRYGACDIESNQTGVKLRRKIFGAMENDRYLVRVRVQLAPNVCGDVTQLHKESVIGLAWVSLEKVQFPTNHSIAALRRFLFNLAQSVVANSGSRAGHEASIGRRSFIITRSS
jgi:hypothetical protein